MSDIQLSITGEPATVKDIIKALTKLRADRFYGRLGRRAFLSKWKKLRAQLNATGEYAQFRQMVIERDKEHCSCGVYSRMVHHKIPVAFDPSKSLEVENGKVVCGPCHQKAHPNIKLKKYKNA